MVGKGTQCCAFGCNKRKKRKAEFCRSDSEGSEDEESSAKRRCSRTFHSFPSNPERRQTWVKNVHRKDWSPTIYSRICSDHFLESDIIRNGQKVTLREDAIPVRFKKFPEHLKMVCKQRKPLPDGEFTTTSKASNDCSLQKKDMPERTQDKKNLLDDLIMLDHNYSITESPRKLKRELDKALGRYISLKKKLKASRQEARRAKIRIASLKSVVKELRKNSSPLQIVRKY